MTKLEFVKRMSQAYLDALNQGARVNPAVMFAQAALESNWGNSKLAQKANNLFGIKAFRDWKKSGRPFITLPTKEWNGKQMTIVNADWAMFDSWAACILYYSHLINFLSWYKDALPYLENSEQFLKHILAAPNEPGWATDPKYFDKVKTTALQIEKLGGPQWVG